MIFNSAEEEFYRWHVLEFLEQNLPEHVLTFNPFTFSKDKILEEARTEGFQVFDMIPPGNLANFQGDAFCHVSREIIHFYRRQYFKGKPGKEFKLHRDGDKPASYSPTEIGYFKGGEYHRDDNKPAMLSATEITWNVNGRWHRTDGGPTIINKFYGFKKHVNHDLVWRDTYIKGHRLIQRFAGWENGIGKWELE